MGAVAGGAPALHTRREKQVHRAAQLDVELLQLQAEPAADSATQAASLGRLSG